MPAPDKLSDAAVLKIARVMHEAVRAYQAALGQETVPGWKQAPKWMKIASRDAVLYRIDNPDASPSDQHDQWLDTKKRDGWVFGPVKNGDKKTHPLMVPYDQLPVEERRKDALVSAIVSSLTRDL